MAEQKYLDALTQYFDDLKLDDFSSSQAEQVATALRKAMKGLGTDEQALIDNIVPLTSRQIQTVIEAYTTHIKRDLLEDVACETRGNFETVMLALLTHPIAYDAQVIRNAIKGVGTDEQALIDTLCTRTPDEIEQISDVYRHTYDSFMDQDILDDLGGDLKALFAMLLKSERAESIDTVEDSVLKLRKAGTGKVGTDEKVFIDVLAGNSREYVTKVCTKYAETHGETMTAVIKKEFGGHMEKALLALVTPVPDYVARRLFEAMDGVGTDDKSLIRLLVSQRERHLPEAAKCFLKAYEKSLRRMVEKDVGGDYKKALVLLIDVFC